MIIGPRFIDPRLWIPLFVGDKALTAPEGTPEFAAVQTIVANYNRISACLADFPGAFRPKFDDRGNGEWDAIFWTGGFVDIREYFMPRRVKDAHRR